MWGFLTRNLKGERDLHLVTSFITPGSVKVNQNRGEMTRSEGDGHRSWKHGLAAGFEGKKPLRRLEVRLFLTAFKPDRKT